MICQSIADAVHLNKGFAINWASNVKTLKTNLLVINQLIRLWNVTNKGYNIVIPSAQAAGRQQYLNYTD